MRIIAFILEPPVIERVLSHIGEPTTAPEVLPARGPPQPELVFREDARPDAWPDMDQTGGTGDDTW